MPASRTGGRLLPLLAAVLGVASGACGRSPLDLAYQPVDLPIVDASAAVDLPAEPVADAAPELAPDLPPDLPPDLVPDLPRDLPSEARPDATPDLPRETAPAERPPVEAGPVCQPQPETCNGLDDNCDGRVDEDQPPIPCPNGGSRYCVGGRYSECPRRCEVCIPGSERECFTSFCLYWGTQFCASDGRSFGTCKETTPPAACRAIADKHKKSPELEQCCIDQGFCCLDDFDLDNDGDTKDMVGRCDTVMCGQ